MQPLRSQVDYFAPLKAGIVKAVLIPSMSSSDRGIVGQCIERRERKMSPSHKPADFFLPPNLRANRHRKDYSAEVRDNEGQAKNRSRANRAKVPK